MVAGMDEADWNAWPVPVAAYAGGTMAADGLIGFPQSMQNLDPDSFSRPQNGQAFMSRRGPGWGGRRAWAREYRPPRMAGSMKQAA